MAGTCNPTAAPMCALCAASPPRPAREQAAWASTDGYRRRTWPTQSQEETCPEQSSSNGARTPMGRLLGGLKDFSGAQLGGFAIKGALEQAGVTPDQVDYVIMGQVLTAGAGQIPARQAAVAAGIGMAVPALTINKVCLSGLNAIALADQLIRAGECEIVVAGGQESMTQAPHLLAKSRSGLQVRRRHDARPHGLRRPALRVRPGLDGRLHGEAQRPLRALPRRSGRVRRALAPARRQGHRLRALRRGDHPGARAPAQGRPDRRRHRRGHPRPTPRPRAWASCAPRSPPTAPSPRARRRRSPTVPPPWSS